MTIKMGGGGECYTSAHYDKYFIKKQKYKEGSRQAIYCFMCGFKKSRF